MELMRTPAVGKTGLTVSTPAPSAFDRAVGVLARRKRSDIIALTASRRAHRDEAISKEGIALCRAALAERRRLRGTKLGRRLRRKVELGRHGAH